MHIDFTVIKTALEDIKIKSSYPKMRALFIELLSGKPCGIINFLIYVTLWSSSYCNAVMYVEVGENRPYLEKIPFSFVSVHLWK